MITSAYTLFWPICFESIIIFVSEYYDAESLIIIQIFGKSIDALSLMKSSRLWPLNDFNFHVYIQSMCFHDIF